MARENVARIAGDRKDRADPGTDLRISEDMKQQLKLIASSSRLKTEGLDVSDFKVVTFDSDLETAVPDPVVMWEKATCC
jgi:hypothetical protein